MDEPFLFFFFFCFVSTGFRGCCCALSAACAVALVAVPGAGCIGDASAVAERLARFAGSEDVLVLVALLSPALMVLSWPLVTRALVGARFGVDAAAVSMMPIPLNCGCTLHDAWVVG